MQPLETGKVDIARLEAVLGSLGADNQAGQDQVELMREALRELPYFTALRVALCLYSGAEPTAEERHALALTVSDPRTLALVAHGVERLSFYPPADPSEHQETDDVIDRFLRTYGSCTPEEEALLERMIFNPTPDYAEMLAREEQENLPSADEAIDPESPQGRINAFILSQHPATHPPSLSDPEPPAVSADSSEAPAPVGRPEPQDDSLLSESLAKIFIKRGRYERAYEIISGISLKYPKKSAYFADQLRFLRKVIKIKQRGGDKSSGADV